MTETLENKLEDFEDSLDSEEISALESIKDNLDDTDIFQDAFESMENEEIDDFFEELLSLWKENQENPEIINNLSNIYNHLAQIQEGTFDSENFLVLSEFLQGQEEESTWEVIEVNQEEVPWETIKEEIIENVRWLWEYKGWVIEEEISLGEQNINFQLNIDDQTLVVGNNEYDIQLPSGANIDSLNLREENIQISGSLWFLSRTEEVQYEDFAEELVKRSIQGEQEIKIGDASFVKRV